ncbi:hypothetical protein E2562_033819 [Oryza meyeriana var. granulata]|uniref:Uncharacterized protein n=1 Tax=Oryza meyeriana var. granulata TaxID=110450 RepID=A0A6G1F1C4_9ORYZ|nr:hypothetical protein E2562_033819 [Oryza meyeriana var. granulata]
MTWDRRWTHVAHEKKEDGNAPEILTTSSWPDADSSFDQNAHAATLGFPRAADGAGRGGRRCGGDLAGWKEAGRRATRELTDAGRGGRHGS